MFLLTLGSLFQSESDLSAMSAETVPSPTWTISIKACPTASSCEYLAPVNEIMTHLAFDQRMHLLITVRGPHSNPDTIWTRFLSRACFVGCLLPWAICFFFCPIIADVMSIMRIIWQSPSISMRLVALVIYFTRRRLWTVRSLQTDCCLRHLLSPL